MYHESKPSPDCKPDTQETDELGRMLRIFVLACLIAGVAAAFGAAQFGDRPATDPQVRVPGGTVPLRGLEAGVAALVVGLFVGGTLGGLVLGEVGRGMVIGAYAGFLGAATGASIGDPLCGVIFGTLVGGVWCAIRLSD